MNETAFLNVVTILRVILVGGILLVIPKVTRKGLLFGTYVGEEFAESAAARRTMRRWYLGGLAIILISLGVGLTISRLGWPLAGNLISLGVLLLGAVFLYMKLHVEARRLAPPEAARQAETSVASLKLGEAGGEGLAKGALVICIVAGVGSLLYAGFSYDALPERIPTHFGASGEPDAWAKKSVGTVMAPSVMNLFIPPFLALFALLTARAKRSLRAGSGGRSEEAQTGFRAAMANVLSVSALFACGLMTFIAVQSIRIGLSQAESLTSAVLWLSVLMVVLLVSLLIWITWKYGQGGARLEEGSAAAPLTNGLADDSKWVWGIFYANRDDPSILVEKRFGIGYTINFGNPRAVLIVVVFLAVILGLALLSAVGVID